MKTNNFLTKKFKTAFFDAVDDLSLERSELKQTLHFEYKGKEVYAELDVHIQDNLEIYTEAFTEAVSIHDLEINNETMDKQQGELLALDYNELIKFLEA